jgi:hypothetical protein
LTQANSMIFESLSTRLSAPFGANAPFQPGRLNRRVFLERD